MTAPRYFSTSQVLCYKAYAKVLTDLFETIMGPDTKGVYGKKRYVLQPLRTYVFRASILILTTILALIGMRWMLFFASMDTIRITPATTPYTTPSLAQKDLLWTETYNNTAALNSGIFRGANEFLAGACFPTEPEMNVVNGMEQSGFRELYHQRYPERNLYYAVGLNFEHIISGRLADEYRNSFTPRKERVSLWQHSEDSASLFWPSETSAWAVASEMTYAFGAGPYLDMTFNTALRTPLTQDYLVYMWASYMTRAREPYITFYGVRDLYTFGAGWGKGSIGWVRFGKRRQSEDTNENSAIPFLGSPKLEYEEIEFPHNMACYTRTVFLLPFFYGILDGDGNLSTRNDDMVYLMMFDQAEPIRFLFFDFGGPQDPVWDWQYIIHGPKINQTYRYRARLVYKPFQGVEDVTAEYVSWIKGLAPPVYEVTFSVEPKEGGMFFPENLSGVYGHDVRIYFGVNPAAEWVFDHWEGPVDDPRRRYTGMQVNQASCIRAVCRPKHQAACRGVYQ